MMRSALGGWMAVALLAGCSDTSMPAPDVLNVSDARPVTADATGATDASDATVAPDSTADGGLDAEQLEDGSATGDGSSDVVPVDAARTDAGVDAGPGCAVPGALLCEDFETGMIDPGRWTRETRMATIELDMARSRGRYAMHIQVQAPDRDELREGFIHHRGIFPVARNHFFVRAMVFHQQFLPDKNFILGEATGPLPDGSGSARYGVGGSNTAAPMSSNAAQRFRVVYHPGDYKILSSSQPPIGRWACWEWEVNGTDDSTRVWIDGRTMTEVRAVDERPRWVAPTFRDLAIGYRIPHADSRARYDVWIDDIVIGTQRPGCPR